MAGPAWCAEMGAAAIDAAEPTKKTLSNEKPTPAAVRHRGRTLANQVERFFNRIKQCRRVATRYDRLEAPERTDRGA